MDHDDPEDRITEPVTPQEIRDVAFSKPAMEHRVTAKTRSMRFLTASRSNWGAAAANGQQPIQGARSTLPTS
jgi:hypothetical protein